MKVGGHKKLVTRPRVLTYTPTPTGALFHASRKRVKGVLGPVGSGKSVMCCWEIVILSSQQIPNPYDNARRSRSLIALVEDEVCVGGHARPLRAYDGVGLANFPQAEKYKASRCDAECPTRQYPHHKAMENS